MFNRLSIRVKLIAAFAGMLAVTLALGLFSLNRIGAVHGVALDLETSWMPSVQHLGALSIAASDHRFNVALHTINTDDAEMHRIEERLEMWSKRVAEARASYERVISSPEERRIYDEFARLWDGYVGTVEALLPLSRRNERAAATAQLEQRVIPAYRAARTVVERLLKLNIDGGTAAGHAGNAAYDVTFALVVGLLAVAVLLGAGVAWTIVRSIGQGIRSVVAPMQAMTAGDLSVEVPALPERTEMGTIATALRAFREALIAKRAADEAAAVEAQAKAARGERVDALVRGFETDAAEALRVVAAASTELDATAGEMQGAAQAGTTLAASLAAASEEASVNVQTVAASAEEMAASIAEVSRQVTESARVASQAAGDARATDAAVGGLSEAATRIGEVVRLIADIAGQTNLLALNATIEAARAGEHGKGFAVVASEVKTLAQQTAKATEAIGTQIATMQNETTRAVEAIRSIGRTIETLDGLTTAVAAAAEEQSAAMSEIGRAVAEAASGTRDVSRHAGGATESAQQTGAAAAQVRAASGELAQQAEGLRGQVDTFLAALRVA